MMERFIHAMFGLTVLGGFVLAAARLGGAA
jgi:hypothetical protein